MSYARGRHDSVNPRIWYEETYEIKSALFGFINWKKLLKKEKIGEDLYIVCDRTPETVLLNGKRYVPEVTNITLEDTP